MNKTFDRISDYYDLLYANKNYEQEVNYVKKLIDENYPNSKVMLELGSGTGNHSVYFSKLKYEIHGIDLSKSMVNISRGKNILNASFHVGDISNFKFDKKFDVCISLFHVISYVTDLSLLLKVFNNIYSSLKPGGIFIFDCWNKPAVILDPPIIRKTTFENEILKVERTAFPENNFINSVSNIFFELNIFDKKSNTIHKETETHQMRFFSEDEINQVSEESNLKVLGCYNWLDFGPKSSEKYYNVYILKK
jgi:SAM-dependent methyltransferase